MANVFDTLRDQLADGGINPRSKESREWFLSKVETISKNLSRDALMRRPPAQKVATVLPGMMYMFYYDPKHASTLPYYDSFPLVILIDIQNDGMTGLNMHYLPIELRQKLFYGLINRISSNDLTDQTYIKITHDLLKSTRALKEYKPCFKKYLTKHIRGGIAKIPAEEWETAIHLPTSLFRKQNESAVHRESERIIQRF